jgi:hypothetical protein
MFSALRRFLPDAKYNVVMTFSLRKGPSVQDVLQPWPPAGQPPMREKSILELPGVVARLMAARSEEASLSMRVCRHPDDELLYLQWARARQILEQCQQEYVGCVERSDFADLPARAVVEGC